MIRTRLVVFDLDDTLVDTSDVYWHARSRFTELMVGHGLGHLAEITEAFERIDTEHIREFGFAPERYLHTMLATYRRLVGDEKQRPGLQRAIREAASIISSVVPAPIDGAQELLASLRGQFKLAVATRGEQSLQLRKIGAYGWDQVFQTIRVVEAKTRATFESIMAECEARPHETCVVGDSVKSDINPGLEAGASCILFRYQHPQYHWIQEHDQRPLEAVPTVSRLLDVIPLLRHHDEP